MPDVSREIVNVTSFGCCRDEALNFPFGQIMTQMALDLMRCCGGLE